MDVVYQGIVIDPYSQPGMVVVNIVIIYLCRRGNGEVEPIRCALFLNYLIAPLPA